MKELAETAPADPQADWTDAQIGRYAFRRLVGTGGMGVVVAAYDPELDREVAIKLVRGEHGDRPLREAQAMAKLSHPNVVQVYEALRLGERTGIVMELVEGEELGVWQRGRPWRAIVDAYAQACRGLSAAHRAGLVHRDFKPSNALVDKQGVVRVTDFGLAQASADAPTDSAGTPAYMAPEQHRKASIDARTDQWSLACALFEALHGQRPYSGAEELARGQLAPEPTGSPLPRRIRGAIRRALSVEPDDRFPTIDELAAALSHRPRHLPYAVVGGAGITIAVLALMVRSPDAETCRELDEPITTVWTEQVRGNVRARMLAPGIGLPATVVDKALAGIDAFAAAWVSTRVTACTDTQRGVRSAETLDGRMRCLDHRLASLAELLEGLARGDRTTLHTANDAIGELRPPAACADAPSMTHADDLVLRATLEAGELALSRAEAARSLGHYERAIPLAVQAIGAGERGNDLSLAARGLVVQGLSESRINRVAEGLAMFQRGAQIAAKARDLVVMAEALVWAFITEGEDFGHRGNALQGRPYIELALEVAGQPDHVRALWLHGLAILLYRDRSQLEKALAYEREALAIRQRSLPADHIYILDSRETLGHIEAMRGNVEEAIRQHQLVLQARIASRGPEDHIVGWAYNDLGGDEILRNNLLAALDHLQRSVEIARASGKTNQNAVFNLGLTQLELGRWAAAAATFEEALALATKRSKESINVADSASFAGLCHLLSGRRERARPLLVRALEVARKEGADNSSILLTHLALLALEDGELKRARALVEDSGKSAPSNAAMFAYGVARVVHAERGCPASRPLLAKLFSDAVASGDRSVQTFVTAPLAECEIAAGDHAAARARLEAELAWQARMRSDALAGAPLRTALARLRR